MIAYTCTTLGGVVDQVGDQADRAEHLLAVSGIVGIGEAAVVGVGTDDEQLVDQGAKRLSGKPRDL
uniref:hypothetical protein n=1 Tax=Microtetraspora malaysiensis TaxID=161358 RepID=UPI003F49185B